MRSSVPLACAVLVLLAGCTGDEPRENDPEASGVVGLEEVVAGLAAPLFVTHDGVHPDRLYIVEQGGRIRLMEDGTLQDAPFLDLSQKVSSGGERGLLGLAFGPDFLDDGRVYASYTDRDGDSVLARYTQDARERLDVNTEEVLLRVDQPYANHNGGMIAFGPDGHLYYALGDGGSGGDPQGHGQDKGTLLGAILRLDVSGTEGYGIPADNPFVDEEGARGEIWAYGLRNPWRFSFDRATGDLWIGDVGQNAVEEIDHQPAASDGGENYGWNRFEGNKHYTGSVSRSGLTFPVATYDRAGEHCSVTGGYVHRGDVATLEGAYVFGDYCSGNVWTYRDDAGAAYRLLDTSHRISSFGEDLDGRLYLVDHGGKVLRFVET